MSFMTLDVILFRKSESITYFFPFLFFVYLLPRLTNEWPYNTLSVFEKGEIEYTSRANIWLDGFNIFFWQVSIELLFVVFLLFFLAA